MAKRGRKPEHGHCVNGVATPTYYSYWTMLTRCFNSNVIGYPTYGGWGITFCERWRPVHYGGTPGGFERFLGIRRDRLR